MFVKTITNVRRNSCSERKARLLSTENFHLCIEQNVIENVWGKGQMTL